MSSNCLLVARDKITNDFEIKGEFSSLREVDLYTTNYHSNKDLAQKTWKNGIVPKQDIDFFIVMPITYDKKLRIETREVLFSNSKEIRMIDDHEHELNTLSHFTEKIESSNEFLEEVPSYLYENVKNYLLSDEKGKNITYQELREAILSFTSDFKNKDKKEDIYRLLVERKILSRFDENYNEKQLSFEIEEEKDDSNKLVEIISTFRNVGEGFLDIKDGQVFITNNMYTIDENMDLLDSLLDQRLGFILHSYTQIKNSNDDNKKILLENAEIKMIELLSNDRYLLAKTYKLTKILNNSLNKLLGDNNGYQYKKY